PFSIRDAGRECVEQGGLACSRPAAHDDVAPSSYGPLEQVSHATRAELAQRDRLGTKAPDRDAGAVDRERRYDDVDARAVRQPGVDDWAGSVDSQAERRHDPLDQLIGVAG